ncbi:unnamed protein product [Rhodiola kirilowii]
MQKKFLDKYYPAGRAMQVRRQLQDLRQGPNETMYEYVEKFNALEQSCCNLGLPEKLIVEYMLNGLRKLDRKLLDNSARGTLMRLTPAGVRKKIVEVAENARFQDESNNKEEFSRTRNVSQVEPPSGTMAEEIKQLKEMMQQVIRRQPVQAKPCEFCGALDHKTDGCSTLVEDDQGEVNAVGDYQSYGSRTGPNRQYGQGANGQGWRNDNQAPREPAQQQGSYNNRNQYQQRGQNQNQAGPSQQGKSLEDIVKDLVISVHQFQAKTDGAIADLSKQMSQIATTVSELKNDPGRLPSQIIPNPKGNVNAVTLRSGKELENSEKEADSVRIAPTIDISPTLMSKENAPLTSSENAPITSKQNAIRTAEKSKIDLSLPFPMQVKAPRKYMIDKDVWELFSKVEINIPLLEAIKQISRYAKFLKELCTNRRRSTREDQELLSKNVSAVIQRKVPPKCGDPGTYTIPCTIGNIRIENCMLDLGASINVLPYSIYSCLRIGPLEPAGLTIQLVDRSCKQPEGKIEDVLV